MSTMNTIPAERMSYQNGKTAPTSSPFNLSENLVATILSGVSGRLQEILDFPPNLEGPAPYFTQGDMLVLSRQGYGESNLIRMAMSDGYLLRQLALSPESDLKQSLKDAILAVFPDNRAFSSDGFVAMPLASFNSIATEAPQVPGKKNPYIMPASAPEVSRPNPTSQHYSVQLSIFVRADSEAEACDALAEGLREVVPDWGYLEYGDPKPCHTSAGHHVARIAVLVPGDNERECLRHLNEMLKPVAISWAVSPDGPSVSEYDPTCPSYDEGDFLAAFREPNPEDLHILMQAPGE